MDNWLNCLRIFTVVLTLLIGSTARGRPRLEMLDDLITLSYIDLKRKDEDSEGWKGYNAMDLPLGSTLRERLTLINIMMYDEGSIDHFLFQHLSVANCVLVGQLVLQYAV